MKKLSFWASVLLCAPVWAGAQTASPRPPAVITDPAAPVPPVVYQSVFVDTSTGVERQSVDWTKANTEVGQFKRGHADILKWEELQPVNATPHAHPRKP